ASPGSALTGRSGRTAKVRDLDDALAVVTDGCVLAVGGLWFHNAPSAAVRALVKRGVQNLELLTAPPSSFTTDLLVGAGCVRRAYLPHVSFEHLGLAPNVRRAAAPPHGVSWRCAPTWPGSSRKREAGWATPATGGRRAASRCSRRRPDTSSSPSTRSSTTRWSEPSRTAPRCRATSSTPWSR